MRKSHTLAICILIGSVLLVSGWMFVFALRPVEATFNNSGTIRTVGVEVYADEALTQPLTHIDWESVSPGETKASSAWVVNSGNDAITLQMLTENWSPTEASQWINLTWNYDGSSIPGGLSIPVTFSLSVDVDVTGLTDFSFDILIEGEPPTGTNANLLVTDSTPEGAVLFLIDGSSTYQTGATYSLETGIHIIELPSPYTSPISGVTYEFSYWDDDPSLTSSTRQINLSADTSLHGVYTET
jgi:hypothetical protein